MIKLNSKVELPFTLHFATKAEEILEKGEGFYNENSQKWDGPIINMATRCGCSSTGLFNIDDDKDKDD